MKCSKYKKLLVEFTDGRLDYHKNQDVQEHIISCVTCKCEVDKLRSSIELVKSNNILSKEPRPPDNLPEQVLDRIYNERNQSGVSFSPVLGTVAIICLIGLILEIFLINRPSEKQDTFMYQIVTTSTKTDLPKIRLSKHDSTQPAFKADTKVKSRVVKNIELSNNQHKSKNSLQRANAYVSMEILKLLGPTLEVIEGEEKEWEIEI